MPRRPPRRSHRSCDATASTPDPPRRLRLCAHRQGRRTPTPDPGALTCRDRITYLMETEDCPAGSRPSRRRRSASARSLTTPLSSSAASTSRSPSRMSPICPTRPSTVSLRCRSLPTSLLAEMKQRRPSDIVAIRSSVGSSVSKSSRTVCSSLGNSRPATGWSRSAWTARYVAATTRNTPPTASAWPALLTAELLSVSVSTRIQVQPYAQPQTGSAAGQYGYAQASATARSSGTPKW
jgi:hypothetical protein